MYMASKSQHQFLLRRNHIPWHWVRYCRTFAKSLRHASQAEYLYGLQTGGGMECRGSLGERNNLKECEDVFVMGVNKWCYSRQTPTIEEPCQGSLLRIVRNVWPKAIDHTLKVFVGTAYNIRGCHIRFQ